MVKRKPLLQIVTEVRSERAMMSVIAENLKRIKKEIAARTVAVGYDPNDVAIIAVTKTHKPQLINEAIVNGIMDIGENRVQEILEKYDDVLPVNWHMIGHLQRNKVKLIIDKVKMIHSVDSFRLAEEIDLRAGSIGKVMDVLIQVNIAGEESKSGIGADDAKVLIGQMLENCRNICVRGLMCIAPFVDDPEDARPYFREAKTLFDSFRMIVHERLDLRFLSMGMSGDFGVAVEEGSNMLRIGTAIFGSR